jgi:hypothetical protein
VRAPVHRARRALQSLFELVDTWASTIKLVE